MDQLKRILFVVKDDAFSSDSSNALSVAKTLASLSGARIHVLKVLEAPSAARLPLDESRVEQVLESLYAENEKALKTLCEQAFSGLGIEFTLDVTVGKEFVEVIRRVQQSSVDLVIKEAEDPSWLSSVFGSADLHLLRKCPCPLFLIKGGRQTNIKRIGVAVDLADDDEVLNRELMCQSAFLASAYEADIHMLHAYDVALAGFASMWAEDPESVQRDFANQAYLQQREAAASLEEALSPSLNIRGRLSKYIVEGKAEHQIPELVKKLGIDVLVMGTIGRSGMLGLLIGNTAESVLMQLNCSVLALKPPGFVCPIVFD